MTTRLILFEDNDLLRESLTGLISLNESLQLAGAYGDVLSVKELVQKHRPDLVIMDIEMPGMTGIEAVGQIRQTDPQLPVLMLTVFEDSTHVFDALRAGASGYLLKKHIAARLFSAIDEIRSGGAPMSPGVARMVISAMYRPAPGPNYGLTLREKEILNLLSQGNSYKIIAARLEISLDTVRTHIKKIYEKLHVHCQTEAVLKAINERLV
jgi:DNA-binding NarL/FixJ family response regulator